MNSGLSARPANPEMAKGPARRSIALITKIPLARLNLPRDYALPWRRKLRFSQARREGAATNMSFMPRGGMIARRDGALKVSGLSANPPLR
jgi:hypothetical protein